MSQVGRDAVLISVMIELSTLCQLNLNNGIIRFLPDLGRSSAPCDRGRICRLGAIGPNRRDQLRVRGAPCVAASSAFLGDDPALQVGFVVALVLWGVFALQDAVLTATRRASWVPLENGLFGCAEARCAAPCCSAAAVGNGVFAAWVLPMALLVIPVNVFIFRRAIPAHVEGERT